MARTPPIRDRQIAESRDACASTSEMADSRAAQQSSGPGSREVFNTYEAADFLRVSPALLELLRVQGGGPRFVKLSRRVLYRRGALDDWLKERERSSTADYGSRKTNYA